MAQAQANATGRNTAPVAGNKGAATNAKIALAASIKRAEEAGKAAGDNSVIGFIRKALEDTSKADSALSLGIQRAARGILEGVSSGQIPVDKVSFGAASKSEEARKNVNAIVLVAVLGTKEKAKGPRSDAMVTKQEARNTAEQRLRRAILLSSILYSAGIKSDAFDDQRGWAVKAGLLLREEQKFPSDATVNSLVHLDNQSMIVLVKNKDGEGFSKVRRSVDTILAAQTGKERSERQVRQPATAVNLKSAEDFIVTSFSGKDADQLTKEQQQSARRILSILAGVFTPAKLAAVAKQGDALFQASA
jgi:hypothetical protein